MTREAQWTGDVKICLIINQLRGLKTSFEEAASETAPSDTNLRITLEN